MSFAILAVVAIYDRLDCPHGNTCGSLSLEIVRVETVIVRCDDNGSTVNGQCAPFLLRREIGRISYAWLVISGRAWEVRLDWQCIGTAGQSVASAETYEDRE